MSAEKIHRTLAWRTNFRIGSKPDEEEISEAPCVPGITAGRLEKGM